ncbi:MarR family winged helix-turn-helix transcriptional regulator [Streptomyces sp. bgisy031]|uniref:MarR family winged helix-turn-helix transcriptional regulator n=1 Tax=Streptomyces sp. bgisy031 TaxID=3413772 RepID=UPI003D7270E4
MAGSTLSRLSNVVGRLEKRGWARRRADPVDGRSTLAALTEEGWGKVEAQHRSRSKPSADSCSTRSPRCSNATSARLSRTLTGA